MIEAETARRRCSSAARTSLRALPAMLTCAALALAALMLVPPLLGYERYVITGGSMSGTIERGSIAFADVVPVAALDEGDVITYAPPPRSGIEGLVTHRIISVKIDRSGEAVFRTQGDTNPDPDPWRFGLSAPTQARYELSVPYLGYAFAALGTREVRMIVIGLPALLIALSLLTRLWREAGVEAERRRSAKAMPGAS